MELVLHIRVFGYNQRRMKTQIITLESHDDLIAIRDRMSWAKTPRILLVAPKFIRVNLRQVDLKVLQRHAATLGAQLGLVTRQRRFRADAEAVGIPVFTSTGEAQRIAWVEIRRKRLKRKAPDKTLREKRGQVQVGEGAWRAHPWVRISVFLVGVVSVLALAALFVPRAQVRVSHLTKTQRIDIPVTANPSVKDVFITGSIPAREKRILVEGEQKVLVTGEGIVPQSNAKGVVTFRNLTEDEVEIPAGTILRSNEIRFVTTEAGAVDAGVGETVELPIEAVDGGVSGNLEAETIDTVEGRLGLSLSVTNPEPTEGGRERASVQATDNDRMRARDLLLKSLEELARDGLLDEFNPGDVFFEDTFALSQVISENYDLPSGAPGLQLTLTMQVEFTVLCANASDLTELASLALNASLPPDFSPVSDKVNIESMTEPRSMDDGSLRWTMRADREIVQRVNNARVIQLIMGLGSSEAQNRLEKNMPALNTPKVSLTPSWWPWVPIVPFRIEVVAQ